MYIKSGKCNLLRSTALYAIPLVAVLVSSGCTTYVHDGHHDRYRHGHYHPHVYFEFIYYPHAHVYFDRYRHVYHYYHKRRGWVAVRKLPRHIRLHGYPHHKLRSRHNHPWTEHHPYKRHRGHGDYTPRRHHQERRDTNREGHDPGREQRSPQERRYKQAPRQSRKEYREHQKERRKHREEQRQEDGNLHEDRYKRDL